MFKNFFYKITHKAVEEKEVIKRWKKNNKPIPPPHEYKELVIRNYSKKFKISLLVESGTYLGEMVKALEKHFEYIHSIELDKKLYSDAQRKFLCSNNVTIYNGDSGMVIKKILRKIHYPCIFWLDGHYSEGITAKGNLNTPIVNELKAILSHSVKKHILLIDDARLFNGKDDYPTIAQIRKIIHKYKAKYKCIIINDIIRIIPYD